MTEFELLIDPATQGDPISPFALDVQVDPRADRSPLREKGHQVSDLVVRRLLREGGYSLQANVKTAEGGQHIDRDAQSRVLNDGAVEHMSSGDPVISVDNRRNSRRLQERWTGMATHR